VPHETRTKKTAATPRARRARSSSSQASSRTRRRREVGSRPRPRGDAAGTVGPVREQPPLIRLLEALEAEPIRYIVIGMAAAVAQGVMANTLDVDLWIDLPARQYMRVLNVARKLGATVAANTVVYLEDGTPVNFVYEVTGLASFSREKQHVTQARIHGHDLPVLKLERILKSKQSIGRDKDKLHIVHIRDFLRCRRQLRRHGRSTQVRQSNQKR
jgi:hypothetical protein